MSRAEPGLPASPEQPTVAARGLGKAYRGRWVIRDLSFTLLPGALLGLVGANGGGKTTTLRMLAGLVTPDAGDGNVLGHPLGRPDARLRRRIGYMSQRLSLYPELSVAENLCFRAEALALKNPRSVVERGAARFGLAPVMTPRVERLSGGWARRAQFAATMTGDPPLLLLDEPTAGLDILTRRAIWRWLAELAAMGHSIVISTHDLTEAERCPSILYYADGGADGPMPPATLIARGGGGSLEEALVHLAEHADEG